MENKERPELAKKIRLEKENKQGANIFGIDTRAASYFSRFKKMVKAAYRSQLLPDNPAAEVKGRAMQGKKTFEPLRK